MDRLPPGQHWVEKFPVLHHGGIPEINAGEWRFFVRGLVSKPSIFDIEGLLKLPRTVFKADFHCVTQWSVKDIEWEGVLFGEIVKLTRPGQNARFVMIYSYGGYSANLPLDILLRDDSLLAFRMNGRPLTPEHGGPVRLVVPPRYGWKSAKWVTGAEFIEKDSPGFWESRGYHNEGDPWKEERYSDG